MTEQARSNCGNCGAALPNRLAQARMVTCDHCGSTSVLRDKVFEIAGTGGEMFETPSLVEIGVPVVVKGLELLPVGLARFSYGRGTWDEFWCLDGADGLWLSADEGDYALERALPQEHWPNGTRPSLGGEIDIRGEVFRVNEAETATCVAVRGEFPEELEIGEAHLYFDLIGPHGQIATYESWEGGETWSAGHWVDPWEVRRA
ncbi:MAG: DUF4178 domain-containing protein [Silicimonas sp.]|nr:DUF4178 domain-containing protein [Silicimonas sp.]